MSDVARSLEKVRKILEEAPSSPVSTLLNKMTILARDLQDTGLEKWCFLELRGYFDDNPVITPDVRNPEYRRVVGDIRDSFGRSVPVSDAALRSYYLRSPAAELEALSTQDGLTLRDPEHMELLRERLGIPADRYFVPRSSVVSVLDGVRAEAIQRLLAVQARLGSQEDPSPKGEQAPMVDRKKVFVIYGRNERLRESVFQLLRDAGLDPREWNKLVLETGHGSPHNLEVVTKGLSTAVAVVALWSGDDLARLRPDLHGPGEAPESERAQPRSNVILETGLALATKRENVVIVRVGSIRNASDLDGLNYVTIQDGGQKDVKGRKNLLDRLVAVGAAVDIEGKTDWMKAGSFKDDPLPAADPPATAPSTPRTIAPSGTVQVLEHEIMSSGFTGGSTALKKIVLKNVAAGDIWRVRLKVTYSTHGGTLGSRVFVLGDEATHPPILPKGATVTFLWTKRGRKGTRPPDARFLNHSITEVSGKATKAVVEVEGFDEVR